MLPIGSTKVSITKISNGEISNSARNFCCRRDLESDSFSGVPSAARSGIFWVVSAIINYLKINYKEKGKGQMPLSLTRICGLLCQPCLEFCIDIITIICPESIIIQEGILCIIRVCWHMRGHIDTQIGMLANQRCR